VFAVVQGSIVTPANFTGVRANYSLSVSGPQTNPLDWSFLVTAPIANLRVDHTASSAPAVGDTEEEWDCGVVLGDRDAGFHAGATGRDMLGGRSAAQKMAIAAGAGVGNVLAMSAATVTQSASGTLFSAPVSAPSCTLTVKFALTGF
jgi:hypothetical protein